MLKKMVSILPLAILLLPPNTLLAASPRHYPATGGGTTEFNWQDEWGTIHLNSFADGLNRSSCEYGWSSSL